MATDLPVLDDRTFAQIRDELLQRIPRYTPEWTDWNESDPGVTLIELFAWLAESIGYRLDQAPERALLTFLDVLGIGPEPARPAQTDLTFTVRQGVSAPITIPARTVVESSVQDDDGPILFETERGLELLPLRLQSLQVAGLAGIDLYAVEDTGPPEFRPFGAQPQTDNAFYLGFGPGDVPVSFPDQVTLLFDPVPREESPPTDARLQWEYRTSAAVDRWTPLETYADGTRSLTRRGYVQLAGPRNSVAVAEVGKETRPLHWLRCRLAGGHYESGHTPVIGMLRYNTVEAVSLSSVTGEIAGQTNGRAHQVVRLRHGSVAADPVVRTVAPADAGTSTLTETWRVVRDLVESGPDDRDVSVDATTGEVRFGDGQQGQLPLAGLDVVVSYRHGGGAQANVPRDSATTLRTVPPGVESVTNQRQAQGGQDQESRESLRRSAASRLRGDERAVTADDYRRLARKVGGVADAAAIELLHPDYPGVPVPGCVTVAVLPESDAPRTPASPELLDVVRDALEPARTIGTELFVRSAGYVVVDVGVVVEVDPYASFGEVHAAVRGSVERELDPVPAAGPAAATQFGRDFFPTRLFGVVQGIPDVLAVPLLQVTVDGRARDEVADRVVVAADRIAVLGQVTVDVRPVRDR